MTKSVYDSLELKRARDLKLDYEEWRRLRDQAMKDACQQTSQEGRQKAMITASMAEERASKAWEQISRLKRVILREWRVPERVIHENRLEIAKLVARRYGEKDKSVD